MDRNHSPFFLTPLGLHCVTLHKALLLCQVLCYHLAQPGTWTWGNATFSPSGRLGWVAKGYMAPSYCCGWNRYHSFCHCDMSQQYLWALCLTICEPLIFAYHVQNSAKISGVFPKLRQSMNDVGEGSYPGMNSGIGRYF